MSTTFITYHYCKEPGHKVKHCKRKLEREYDMEKTGNFNHEREKKWCSCHQTTGHSDKQCYQQMGKSENFRPLLGKITTVKYRGIFHGNW